MKKKIIQIVLVCILAILFSHEHAVYANQDSQGEVNDDPINLLLSANDLLPTCEWQQTPIVTRKVAEGMLTFTEFTCGSGANIRRLTQNILITAKELKAGDANYFVSLRDIENDDVQIALGDWATNYRTMYDRSAIVFTKRNVLVYLADSGGYTNNDDDLLQLANVVNNNIPDEFYSLSFSSSNSDLSLDQEYIENITVSQPEMSFTKIEGDTPAMIITGKTTFDPINFTAEFTEPREVMISIRSEGSDEMISRWIFPESKQHSYQIDKLFDPAPILGVDNAFNYFFRQGTYVIEATVDGQLIYRTQYFTLD